MRCFGLLFAALKVLTDSPFPMWGEAERVYQHSTGVRVLTMHSQHFVCSSAYSYILSVALCALSMPLPPPTPRLLRCPSSPCCTASVRGELRAVPEESPMSVHYLISGGAGCRDSFDAHSHTVQTQLILGGGWGRWRAIYTCITDHRPSRRVRKMHVHGGTKRFFDKNVTTSGFPPPPRSRLTSTERYQQFQAEKCSGIIVCAASRRAQRTRLC